jgi:hypothetical protein
MGKDKSLCQVNFLSEEFLELLKDFTQDIFVDEAYLESLNEHLKDESEQPTVDEFPLYLDQFLDGLGFQNVEWLDVKFKVKDNCYLRGLNSIFPGGIPMMSCFPSLFVQDKPCFEVEWQGKPNQILALVVNVYKGDEVPFSLWAALSFFNTIPIPADLVEELIPDEVKHFLDSYV